MECRSVSVMIFHAIRHTDYYTANLLIFFCNLFIKVIFSITDRTSTACDYAGSLPVESVYELVDNEL